MQLQHLFSETDFSSSHQPTDLHKGGSLCNICVRVSLDQSLYLPPSSWLCDRADLGSLLCERSMGVMAKVVPVQRGPESHKVSVVLLKCCSILFICKCCNLSVNVVNTNEQENLQLYFLERSARPSRDALPEITHLSAAGRASLCEESGSTRGCLLTAL